jgi:hypothetical protein
VLVWIGFERMHSPDGSIDLSRWHDSTVLRDSVNDHDRSAVVEEVEHPVLNPSDPCSEFMNSVAQVICSRPPEQMTFVGEQDEPCTTSDHRHFG